MEANMKLVLPTIDKGMVLEYKDLTGRWYEYTKDLQDNQYFFPPLGTRVRNLKDQLETEVTILIARDKNFVDLP